MKHALASLGTLAVAALGFLLLRDHAVAVALTLGVGALLLPIFWLLVSAMRPAFPDRKCPKCGEESLRLLRPGERVGVRCPRCGLEDEELYVAYLIDVDDDLTDAAPPG